MTGVARTCGTAALVALLPAAASPAETPSAGAASDLLVRVRASGLEAIERHPAGGPAPALLRGRLPGSGGLSVVLLGGCDPRPAEAAAGRAAVLAAVRDLARTPRLHELEVVLCDGRSAAEAAARAWLRLTTPASGERYLALVHLQATAAVAPAGLVLSAAGADAGRRLPPAWLLHAALAGSAAARLELGWAGDRWPLMSQLLARYGRPRKGSGIEPLLAAGVPAITLTGGAAELAPVAAAIARRLDGLAGRPRGDDSHLIVGGRVRSRRDLYWTGVAVWVVLLLVGLPGRWRGASGAARRRRGRRYLPGFALRVLYLAALLAAPAATVLLLAPAALLTLVPVRRRVAALGLRLLAAAPTAAFATHLMAAVLAGRVEPWPAAAGRLALVLAGVTLATALIGRRPAPAPPGPQ